MPNGSPLTFEALPGNSPGAVILRLNGPIVLAGILPLRAQFRGSELPQLTILDMSGVPYVDSAGMSEIINHHIYCRDRKVRLVVAAVTPRVLSMLQVTRLDHVLVLTETVEDAEALV
jgi:anti-anti-sigma factor